MLTYGHRDSNKLSLFQSWTGRGDEVAQYDTNDHGEKNPYREEAVEPAERLERRDIVLLAGFFGRWYVILGVVSRRLLFRTVMVCVGHIYLDLEDCVEC